MEEDDVLELTQFAPEPLDFEEDMPDIEPEPTARPFFGEPDHNRLVSSATAAASSAAFASVSERLNKSRRMPEQVPMGNMGATLEDITKDLLRPLLRDWLDQNLPGVVERIVREEVERLARDAF